MTLFDLSQLAQRQSLVDGAQTALELAVVAAFAEVGDRNGGGASNGASGSSNNDAGVAAKECPLNTEVAVGGGGEWVSVRGETQAIFLGALRREVEKICLAFAPPEVD